MGAHVNEPERAPGEDRYKTSMQNMSLHQVIKVQENVTVMRVPGGWMYEIHNPGHPVTYQFISYSTKFESVQI